MKFKKRVLAISIIVLFILTSIFFPYDLYTKYSDGMFVTTDELKEIADYITESVYEDGFVRAMEKFCLG